MSKDARNEDLDLTPEQKEKFDELVALLAESGFGESGPPLETTFSQIEQFGHQAGRMLGRAIDRLLAEQHAAHFQGEQPCPTCHEMHPPNEEPHTLPVQTLDGEVPLPEPAFNCSPCRRAFFPSASCIEDGRRVGQSGHSGEEGVGGCARAVL